MNIGSLRHRVTLDVAPLDSDGLDTPLVPVEVWAAIEPFAPQDTERERVLSARIRYHPGVKIDTRLTFSGRQLYVKGIQNVDERNIELRLICEEVLQ